jgi:hypothetical protein
VEQKSMSLQKGSVVHVMKLQALRKVKDE